MRIAIISDIHEDLINLQLAFKKIERLKCDRVVCLGDISGYTIPHHNYFDSRNAGKCLELVRKYCSIIISGNHDLYGAKCTPENSNFKYPQNWYELDFYERFAISKNRVWLYEHEELNTLYTKEEQNFIKNLPEYEMATFDNTPVLFTHFIFPNLTGSEKEFYFEAEDYNQHKQFMYEKGARLSFSGHRHPPGLLVVNNSKILLKGFARKYKLRPHDSVLIPPITRALGKSGFCVYDTEQETVKAIRI